MQENEAQKEAKRDELKFNGWLDLRKLFHMETTGCRPVTYLPKKTETVVKCTKSCHNLFLF